MKMAVLVVMTTIKILVMIWVMVLGTIDDYYKMISIIYSSSNMAKISV